MHRILPNPGTAQTARITSCSESFHTFPPNIGFRLAGCKFHLFQKCCQRITRISARKGSRGFGNTGNQANGIFRGSREDEGEEMAERAVDALFQQLAEDLGEEYIDPDEELSEEDMLQLERELTAALQAEQGGAGGGASLEEEEEEVEEGDAEEAEEMFEEKDEDELQIENIEVAINVMGALLEAADGTDKIGLLWNSQVQECVVSIKNLLQQMVALDSDSDDSEDSELEADEEELRRCLAVLDKLLEALAESPGVQDEAVLLGVDTDSVETAALVLQALLDQGGGEEEEVEEEEEGEEGEEEEEEEAVLREGAGGVGSAEPEVERKGRQVELAEWQLRKLVKALQLGKRHVDIKGLVGETGLERRDVLAFLSHPPPGVEELEFKERKERQPPAQGVEVKVEVAAGPWSPKVQQERHGRRRLSAEHNATLERVFATSRFPPRATVDSLVHLTRLPRPLILEWFSEQRGEGGGGQGKWAASQQRWKG